tara:strand:- start:211 stop:522 length:312 start_codon:yes stop_codon:yes gene_type:complete
MEDFIGIAERFGLPVVMLLGMSYGGIQLFKWLSADLLRQIQQNAERIEKIVIALIDNSKKEREQNRELHKENIALNRQLFERMDSIVDVLVKLSGNGLRKKDK